MSLADIYPPAALSLRCGDVELRWMSDGDLVDLVSVARAGVHPEGFMPFGVAWTRASPEDLPNNLLSYHWEQRAGMGPAQWRLNFGTVYRGQLVGSQSLAATNFLLTRTASTGSWLGREFQGQGIGTIQRQLAVAFAFDHLGAVQCRSGAYVDNAASLAVSRKVGYRIVETTREPRPDDQGWGLHHTLVATPDSFIRPELPIEVAGVEAFRRFIGLND